MEPDPRAAERPERQPLHHTPPAHWQPRPDPFAHTDRPHRGIAHPEEAADRRNGGLAAVAAGLILLVGAVLVTLIFTDLFR